MIQGGGQHQCISESSRREGKRLYFSRVVVPCFVIACLKAGCPLPTAEAPTPQKARHVSTTQCQASEKSMSESMTREGEAEHSRGGPLAEAQQDKKGVTWESSRRTPRRCPNVRRVNWACERGLEHLPARCMERVEVVRPLVLIPPPPFFFFFRCRVRILYFVFFLGFFFLFCCFAPFCLCFVCVRLSCRLCQASPPETLTILGDFDRKKAH